MVLFNAINTSQHFPKNAHTGNTQKMSRSSDVIPFPLPSTTNVVRLHKLSDSDKMIHSFTKQERYIDIERKVTFVGNKFPCKT